METSIPKYSDSKIESMNPHSVSSMFEEKLLFDVIDFILTNPVDKEIIYIVIHKFNLKESWISIIAKILELKLKKKNQEQIFDELKYEPTNIKYEGKKGLIPGLASEPDLVVKKDSLKISRT